MFRRFNSARVLFAIGMIAFLLMTSNVAGTTPQTGNLTETFVCDKARQLGISSLVCVVIDSNGKFTTLSNSNNSDQRFLVASLTKPVVAAVTLELVADGKLELDEDLTPLLEKYLLPNDRGRKITARMLMTHTAGLDERNFGMNSRDLQIPLDTFLLQEPVHFIAPANACIIYSNLGYVLLGRVIEMKSGMSFADAAERYVLSKIEAPTATFSQQVGRDYTVNGIPAVGLQISTPDYARFLREILRDPSESGALHPQTRRALLEPMFSVAPGCPGRTAGFVEEPRYTERVLVHTGEWLGYSGITFILPERGLGLIVLGNRENVGMLYYDLLDQLGLQVKATATDLSKALGKSSITSVRRFRGTHYAHNSADKLEIISPFAEGEVVLVPVDGGFRLEGVLYPGSLWYQIGSDPDVFASHSGDSLGRIVINQAGGQTYLSFNGYTYEEISFMQRSGSNQLIIGCLAFLAVFTVIRPTWQRKEARPVSTAIAAGIGLTILSAAAGIAWALLSDGQYTVSFGRPWELTWISVLPIVTVSLAILLAFVTVFDLRTHRPGVLGNLVAITAGVSWLFVCDLYNILA